MSPNKCTAATPRQLPLPGMETLMQRYVEFLDPLDGVEEKQTSIAFALQVLEVLRGNGGAAPPEWCNIASYLRFLETLARRYKNFCNMSLRTSHMAPLWNAMYLGNREPLPIGWNYTLHLDGPSLEQPCTQLGVTPQALRAAIIAAASFHVRQLVEHPNFFTPESQSSLPKLCRVDLTLCRDQFSRLFRTVRIPHVSMDGLHWSHTNKILLLRRGYPLILDWTHFPQADRVRALGVHWLQEVIANARIIDAIIRETSAFSVKKDSPLVLASGCRERWAHVFQELWKNSVSRSALSDITSCSFGIALDDDIDPSISLHGGKYPENRYPDMNVMYAVNPIGGASCNMEHSWGDGSTMMLVCSVIYHYTTSLLSEDLRAENVTACVDSPDYRANVRHVQFGPLSGNHVLEYIDEVHRAHEQRVNEIKMTVRYIKELGANDIKKHCRVSPDAFMHAAFHLAQKRLFGEQRSTYCALMMKKYYHGRTETLRTVTHATQKLADAMLQVHEMESHCPKVLEAMQKVSEEHRSRITFCRKGDGFHRAATLFRRIHSEVKERLPRAALSNFTFDIAKSVESVEKLFFASSAFEELCSDYLSTSNITAIGISSFSFVPTHPDGLGIGYSVFPDKITFTVSSFNGCSRPLISNNRNNHGEKGDVCVAYADTLVQAVLDLYRLASKLSHSKL